MLGLAIMTMLTSCLHQPTKSKFDAIGDYTVAPFSYKGHDYLALEGYSRMGLVHDPACPCKDKQDNGHR